MQTNATTPSFSLLPDELLLHILSFLDVPDLLSFSRASTHLRTLSLDPLLHSSRLHRASFTLSHSLPLRPSLAELIAHRIYITRTTLAARNLGRNLIKIKLNRQLLKRPSAEELVEWGVLPGECYNTKKGQCLAPSLVETKRRVERERVKDVLRGWVEEWRRRGDKVLENERNEAQKPDVRRIAKRFARERDGREQPRWERRVECKEMPTRAKVLGLRRFWEKVGREGVAA
jgi:hypothetical protein